MRRQEVAREHSVKKNNSTTTDKNGVFSWKKAERIVFVLACIGLAVFAVHVFFGPSGSDDKPSQKETDSKIGELNSDIVGAKPKATSLSQLLTLPKEKLADVDVAAMNLHCAEGLPGSETLNVNKCLETLDGWAKHVKTETDRYMYKFSRNPHEYKNSDGYFRMMMLATILQKDFGIHYDIQKTRSADFRNSRELFINGVLSDVSSGTGVSTPVLYLAVGRRLNYPLKIVLAKEHFFIRWEGSENLNIEFTGDGISCPPDDYYKTWPVRMTPQEIASGRYLRSLTPSEELAMFLANRGHCLLDNSRNAEAQIAYAQASRLAPAEPSYLAWMDDAARQQPGPLGQEYGRTGDYQGGNAASRDPMAELHRIQAINDRNRSMMRGRQPETLQSPVIPGVNHPMPPDMRRMPNPQPH